MERLENCFKQLDTYKNLVDQKKNKKFFHANLFCSPDKLTNQTFCKLIAKLLVCESECDNSTCEQCVKVDSDSNPDVKFFGQNSRFSTQDVEKINEDQVLKPMIAKCKVYVIYDFDKATMQAQNKLLKTLEEPGKDVYFILSASNIDAVLPTIKSRCKLIKIEPLKKEYLQQLLECEITDVLIQASEGYIGKFKDLTQGGDFAESQNLAKAIVFDLKSSGQVIDMSSALAGDKKAFQVRLNLIQQLYRQIMFALVGKNEMIDKTNEIKVQNIKGEFTTEAILEILKEIDFCKKKFEANVNLNMICDGLLMKILEVKYLCRQK